MQIWNEFKQDCNDNKIHIQEKNNYGMTNIGINVKIAAREKRIIRYKLQWGVKEFGVKIRPEDSDWEAPTNGRAGCETNGSKIDKYSNYSIYW